MAKEESVEIHSHERHFKEIGAKEKESNGEDIVHMIQIISLLIRFYGKVIIALLAVI